MISSAAIVRHSTVMDLSGVSHCSKVLLATRHCLGVNLEVSRSEIDCFGCLRWGDALHINLRLELVVYVALIHPHIVRSGKFRRIFILDSMIIVLTW